MINKNLKSIKQTNKNTREVKYLGQKPRVWANVSSKLGSKAVSPKHAEYAQVLSTISSTSSGQLQLR